MKNTSKFIFYVIGIMAVVGIAFMIIGKMNNGQLINVDIVRDGVKISEGRGFDIDSSDIGLNLIKGGDGESKLAMDEKVEYDATKVKELTLDLGAREVVIAEAADDMISVTNLGKYPIYTRLNDDELTVSCDDGPNIGLNIGKQAASLKVVIAIPKGTYFEEAKISIGAVKLDANTAISADELTIDLGAGQAIFEGIESHKTDISVGAGQLTIKSFLADELNADIGMGNLELAGDVKKDMDLSCGMGSVKLDMEGELEDHTVEYEVSAGSIRMNGKNLLEGGGEGAIDNNSDSKYELECSMGSIELNWNGML